MSTLEIQLSRPEENGGVVSDNYRRRESGHSDLSPDYDNVFPVVVKVLERGGAQVGVEPINRDVSNGPTNGEVGGAGRGESGVDGYKVEGDAGTGSSCQADVHGVSRQTCATVRQETSMGNKLTTSRVGGATRAERSHRGIGSKVHRKAEQNDHAVTWSRSAQAVTWTGASDAGSSLRSADSGLRDKHVTSVQREKDKAGHPKPQGVAGAGLHPVETGNDPSPANINNGELQDRGARVSATATRPVPDVTISKFETTETSRNSQHRDGGKETDNTSTAAGTNLTLATKQAPSLDFSPTTTTSSVSVSSSSRGQGKSLTPIIIITPGTPETRLQSPFASPSNQVTLSQQTVNNFFSPSQISISETRRADVSAAVQWSGPVTSSAIVASASDVVTSPQACSEDYPPAPGPPPGTAGPVMQSNHDNLLGDYSEPSDVLSGSHVIKMEADSKQMTRTSDVSVGPAQLPQLTTVNGNHHLYKTFPGSAENRMSDPRYASINLDSVSGRGEVIVEESIVTSVVDTEAIYAIPIPKSQRKAKGSDLDTSDRPPLPPWSRHILRETQHESYDEDTFDIETLRSRVEVTSQMKKSTTTGMLNSASNDYYNFPPPATYRNDYFSLGRRPKRIRNPTLVDSKGIAVSLDMLLKVRRQSSLDSPIIPETPTDNLSVDDILKSCSEFDENVPVTYRSRTDSDAMRKSRLNTDWSVAGLINGRLHEKSDIHSTCTAGKGNILEMKADDGRLEQARVLHDQVKTGSSDIPVSPYDVPAGNVTGHSLPVSGDIGCGEHPKETLTFHHRVSETVTENTTTSTATQPTSGVGEVRNGSLVIAKDNNVVEFRTTSLASTVGSPAECANGDRLIVSENSNCVAAVTSESVCVQALSFDASTGTTQAMISGTTSTQTPWTTPITSELSSSHSSSTSSDPRSPHSSISDTQSDTQSLVSPGSVYSEEAPLSLHLLTVDTNGDSTGDVSPARRSPNSGSKLEAVEALKWLRAAGFPQYAQMFDDGQFPIELTFVEKDHDFLDTDSLKSLFRRLETLNKYAGMKIHSHSRKKGTSEEDEEEDLCALSEKWEYQKSARRWSRKEQQSPCTTSPKTFENRAGSHDSLLADQDSGSQTGNSPLLDSKMPHREDASSHWDHRAHLQGQTILPDVSSGYSHSTESSVSPPLRRAASERVKPTKNLWKKMEGMKSKKSRGGQRNIVEISGPVVADKENMQAKLQKFNCRDISPTSDAPQKSDDIKAGHRFSSPASPPTATSPNSGQGSPFRSRHAPVSQSLKARPTPSSHASSPNADHDSSLKEFYSVHSQFLQTLQSAQQQETGVVKKNKSDSNLQEIFILPQNHQPGRFPTVLQNGYIETDSATSHGSVVKDLASLPDSPDGVSFVHGHRVSFYDNWLPADGQTSNIPEESPLHSSTHETNCGTRGNSYSATSAIDSLDGGIQSRSFHSHTLDSIRESRGSSVLSNSDSSTKTGLTGGDSGPEVSDRTEDNNTVSRTLTPNQGVVARDSRLRKSSRESSIESTSSNSEQVTHSASLDSYFLDSESQASSDTLKQDYHEFDLILQQLFDNIKELNSYVTKDKESIGNVTYHPSATTPGGTSQGPLQLAVSGSHQPRYDLDSPVSPTSDLVMSPASPLSPRGVDESVDENSSSGGENQSSGGESSNSGSDDQEVDLSHDDSLDQITEVSMERRDSGVGHSLTRAPGDRRRKKLRWNSFQKCHRPDVTSRAMQINSLSVSQLVRLQKWSLLKLTGIMEKCLPVNKSGWNWMVPRFMKRQKAPDYSDKNVFGVPFTLMAQRTGQPLPQCVLYAMRYLRRTSQNAVGIFRKSGVKSKIQQLRDHLEAHPETTDFEDANAYNVADMLKTYFRDLPECLLTNKMSETFRSIYTYVPQPQRLEAIQAAILLLPDENREVLQSILLFLSDISSHESEHQMNASNLAVCFTPTVFQLGSRHMSTHSPKRNRKNAPGIPDPREILEQKAAHECLLMMITECKKLFTIPAQLFRQLQGQSLAHLEPAPLQDIGNSPAEVKAFGQERIQMVLKEAHDKNRGWVPAMVINDVEIFHRKPLDDCPLKEWKLVIDIEAPPIEVLRRIMHERHAWDEDLLSWSVVERLDPHSDIFQYVLNSMAPHPSRHFCILRYWRSDLTKGACALITMSVEHSDAMEVHGVWAIDLGSFFLMEPCGSGRSRLTYITRVDTRGRTPEWYTKIYGHICSNFLERLRESFKQDSTGPETKV